MTEHKQKKNERKIDFGEITWTLLGIIARTPEALANAFLDHRSLNQHLSGETEFLSDKLIQHLRNLKRSGYIEMKQSDGSTSVRLTTKGKIKQIENSSDKTSDGQLRIISFDIPETIKSKRQQFCRSIRRIGFCRLQKSLWVCPFIKADQIDLIVDDLKIRKYIAYFVVSRSNVEDHINRLFRNQL